MNNNPSKFDVHIENIQNGLLVNFIEKDNHIDHVMKAMKESAKVYIEEFKKIDDDGSEKWKELQEQADNFELPEGVVLPKVRQYGYYYCKDMTEALKMIEAF